MIRMSDVLGELKSMDLSEVEKELSMQEEKAFLKEDSSDSIH